jgi:hypothetical protein
VSRPFLAVSRAPTLCRRQLAEQRRRARVAAGRTRTVHLGRAWFRPKGTQIVFLFSEYMQFLANLKICVGFI